jgi:hypothetical protein
MQAQFPDEIPEADRKTRFVVDEELYEKIKRMRNMDVIINISTPGPAKRPVRTTQRLGDWTLLFHQDAAT